MAIRINLKIFILIALFYFTHQLGIYFCLMFFALLHELGHLLAGVLLGLKPFKITIMPFGLNVSFKSSDINNINIRKLIIAISRSNYKFNNCSDYIHI